MSGRAQAHAVFAHTDFVRYQIARFISTIGTQIASVAVGWQVYDLTGRALDLGFVGLAQFVPSVTLPLVTGAVADRYDRRRIVAVCHAAMALCFVALFVLRMARVASLLPIYAVLVALGTARAFLGPSNQALLPTLVPPSLLASAMAWGSSVWQVAAVTGPALGGVLYASVGAGIYAVSGVCSIASMVAVCSITARSNPSPVHGVTVATLLAGVRYVLHNPLVFGTVTLDLFAVLLGGAVALLPIFARDVLHAGPWGLGLLRASPAVGAALVGLWLAYHPLERHTGRVLLGSVALFGLATIVFGLSRSLVLSMLALAVSGAADMVSVVVRQHTVQVATPDPMRGRVSAVNLVFITMSNELGEFESGVTAEWWGPVRAVLFGGLGTLLVVGLWAWHFPALRRLDRLSDIKPVEVPS